MDKQILELYLQPDVNQDKNYPLLYNLFSSYKTFIKDLRYIFNRRIKLKGNKPNVNYYLEISNLTLDEQNLSYILSYFENTSNDLIINYELNLIKEELIDGEKKETIIPVKRPNNFFEIRIPLLVMFEDESPIGRNKINNPNIKGGYFIVNKGIKKYMTNRKDLNNTNGKYKKKDNLYSFSFNSIPLRFQLDKIISQYLRIDLTFNNFKFNINSNKIFVSINILVLISYLTKISLEDLEEYLLINFNTNKDIIRLIFIKTKVFLLELDDSIDTAKYKHILLSTALFDSKYKEQDLPEHFNNLIQNFLPHLSNNMEKGIFLISIVKQFFVAIFQTDVYPNRDSLIGKRISPVGCIFEETITSLINSTVKEIQDKITKNIPISQILSGINLDMRINKTFINIFNMKEKNTKKIIKPVVNISKYSDIANPNLVIHSGIIVLTRNLTSREIDSSIIGFEDIIDTPDHSENIGLIRRLNISTIITHYTYSEQERLFIDLKRLIISNLGVNFNISKENNVICSIVDYSETPITLSDSKNILKFVELVKKYKRSNYNNFRYIGIELIPNYIFDNSKQIFVPIKDSIFQVKFNISCKRYVKPFIALNKGTLPEIKRNPLEYNNFTEFIQDNNDVVEFLDPGQVAYSNILPDINTFNNISLEDQKTYEYIELTALSNFGCMALSGFGFDRMAGVRSTFTVGQQKQVLVGATEDSFNKFEAGNILLNPYERPCITNSILESSEISTFGKGQHILVGFFSFIDNIEDALIFRKSSVERGLLDALTLNVFKSTTINNLINTNDPLKTINNYSKLNKEGIPSYLTILTKNDAIHKKVNKSYKKVNSRDIDYIFDNSESYGYQIPGRVERVEKRGTDNININILTSSYKQLEPGDKIVNQCAQKGTVGVLYEDHQLPRTSSGLIPDIIINSISIVSRQTFTLFLQAIITKLFSEFPLDENNKIQFRELPVFTNVNIEDILIDIKAEYKNKLPNLTNEELENKMYSSEDAYDYLGNKLTNKLMICPLMYNRSNQMSIDNINVRNTGKLNKLGIPVSGKKKGGGQKYGEMEIDVLVAHGISNILYEVISDVDMNNSNTYFCTNCFTPGTKEIINGIFIRWYCQPCEERNIISRLESFTLTQAFKLTKELLRCRGIDMKLKTKTSKPLYSIDSSN